MPLVRVEVRNEYALGAPELWRPASKEDPKEVLEGVAVAGLVGLLRQLGDLAEFAAEVFHGLQEEVSVTFTRSHKLMARVRRIETALPPLEKAVLAQRSHLHFAYTAGSNWHTRIRCKQNHFVYSDVPQFIMDPYEDSRDPPRLHMLDRFDPGGPGSCLRRYSDPTFFRRASGAFAEVTGKTFKDKKSRKIKKRSSWSRNGDVSRATSFSYHCGTRNGDVSRGTSFSYNSGRMNFTELSVGKHPSPTQTIFTDDTTLRSDWGDESNLELRNRSGYIGSDFCPSQSTQLEEQESRLSISSSVKRRDSDFLDYNFLEGKIAHDYRDDQAKQSLEQAGCGSSSVACDEKTETCEPGVQDYGHDDMSHEDYHLQESIPQLFDTRTVDNHAMNFETAHKMDIQSQNQVIATPETSGLHPVDVDSELVPKKLDLETMGANTGANLETADEMDVQSSNQALSTQESGDIHLEDVESEADDFVDALNIIESESETDTEFVKRKAPKPYSELEDNEVVDRESGLIRHHLEGQSSNSESNILANSSQVNGNCDYDYPSVTPLSPSAANASVSETETKSEINLVSLVDEAIMSAERARDSLNSGSPSRSVDSPDNNRPDDGRSVESVSRTGSFNFTDDNSGLPITDGIRSTPEFRKPVLETVNVASRTIWTNGGLLGLQPSKPPDLSGSNAFPRDMNSMKGEVSGNPYQTDSQKIEEGPCMDTLTNEDYQENGTLFRKPTWKLPPTDLDVKLGKLSDSQCPNNASSTGTVPVNSASQAAKKHEEDGRSSSRMFELSNRLLTNGSSKKLLPCGDQNSKSSSYKNGNSHGLRSSENDAYQAIFGRTKGSFGVDSLIESPSSSPPLQHMKILLQPIDGFEPSKLKMKFADGNANHEISREIFPTFQLVPEVSVTQHHVGSDSDDDTFYRSSSPSLSDDCNSRHSQSNSELWESGESPRSKDHDLYDALQRISLTESVSTVPENGSSTHGDSHHTIGLQFPFADNSIQHSQSSRSFDLQSLEVLNQSFRVELRNNTKLMNLVEQQVTSSPVPPPLPPVEWRGMKPHMDVIEDKCIAMPEGRNYTLDVKHSESTISQQPKPAPFNHDQVFETINVQKSKIFSSQKSNGGRQADQGKNMDEKEDFLQQIRTKSFNLRPIAAAKTTISSGGSANVQVTAILEKANAIRQAVGSDDGEDDSNWSDT